MAGVTGRTVKMAFAKYATNSWGVAASVTKGVYFQSDAGMVQQPDIVEDESMGQVDLGLADRGNTNFVNLSLQGQSRYDDHNYILEALAMGSPNAVTVVSSVAANSLVATSHVIDLADVIDGLGVTIASDLGNYVKEVTSAKVVGFEESIDAGGSVQMETFTVIGSDATTQSSININSTVGGANFPALSNRILKKHGTFRINAQSGGGLGAGDAHRNVDSVRFTFARGMDLSHELGYATGVEPAQNAFSTYSLEVTYNRMTTVSANSLRAALTDGTVFKADWTSTGAYINSTTRFSKTYEFPQIEVIGFEDTVDGPGQVKPRVTYKISKPSAAPTGMSGLTRPFRLTRVMLTNSVIAF